MSKTEGKSITCRAAVCWAAGEALKIEEIQVAPPQSNEIRAKVVASGVVSLVSMNFSQLVTFCTNISAFLMSALLSASTTTNFQSSSVMKERE